jgi:hypothetical protein
MKIRDTIRCDTPAGEKELTFLQSVKIGDIRKEPLFPALGVGVDWICTATGQGYWEFDGRFFGQPLCHVAIKEEAGVLTLAMKDQS